MANKKALALEAMGWIGAGMIAAGLHIEMGTAEALITLGTFVLLYAMANQHGELD